MPSYKLNRYRGQVSLEYVVVVGLVLAACIPVWILAQNRIADAQTQLDAATAQTCVDSLAKAADLVALSGYPAMQTVDVELPHFVQSATASGREVRIVFSGSSGLSEAYAVSQANLTGIIPIGGVRERLVVAASASAPGNVTIGLVG